MDVWHRRAIIRAALRAASRAFILGEKMRKIKKIKMLWVFQEWGLSQKYANKLYFKSWKEQIIVSEGTPGAVMIYSPMLGHEGIDFGIFSGTPIRAAHDGIIVRDDDLIRGSYGNNICLWDT